MRKIFLDLDGTLANFNVANALQRYDREQGFFRKLAAYEGVEQLNELAKTEDLYILSASPNEQADKDKMAWIEMYLYNITASHRLICRCGDNKAKFLQSKGIAIDNQCYLLDDYTKNLVEWEEMGGIGIKRITPLSDNSRKLWKGLELHELQKLSTVIA